ncbi:MAG: site-2 protease family protein [Elusimicrobia bacterium]|nr:site-2 protease family protein [Elusimicrobiota bacterium]
MEWLIQLPVLFFSIIVHEFAHGAVAFRKGDDTAYLSGRLTLNPLPHIDVVGTILLPAMCIMSGFPAIGWAKPVPVNPLRMPRPRHDMAMVALGGPAANIALAAAALVGYKIFAFGFMGRDLTFTLMTAFGFAVIINLLLATFNLLPVFPLDGSHIALEFLPDKWLEIYEKHIPYGMYIIIGLMLSGALKYIIFYPILTIAQFLI